MQVSSPLESERQQLPTIISAKFSVLSVRLKLRHAFCIKQYTKPDVTRYGCWPSRWAFLDKHRSDAVQTDSSVVAFDLELEGSWINT